jgi:thymidylate synthase (FAD)
MPVKLTSELKVELIRFMGNDEAVVDAAKVSTLGQLATATRNYTNEETEKFLDFLMRNRHGSPFEHNAFTFFVSAPIAVFREFQRHRIGFSYNEASGRYMQLEPMFYVPPPVRPLVQVGKPGHYNYVEGTHEQYEQLLDTMKGHFEDTYSAYEELLAAGIAKEVSRGVLPVYIYSSMYVTCNARSLMNFLSLRTKHDDSSFKSFPMWEIERVAQKMESQWANIMPITRELFRKHGSIAP